jgi:hypothetical protein
MRRIALGVLALAFAAGCAGQAQRARGPADEDALRRPFAEPGEGTELRLAAPPPVNRTPVAAASPWAAEAIQVALDELSVYRVKGPEEIRPLLNQSPIGEAYDRFAAQPDAPEIMLAAALAIGRAARCDYVIMEVIDGLSRDEDTTAGFPAILIAYRTHLVHVGSAKILWSQGYSTRLQPKTDEAEPAIRWALLQSERDLVARIPWRKER